MLEVYIIVIGLIFDIERFSTKDGPGIRTVVFFKGCNMNCYWCHNPEGISRAPELKFDAKKCIGCMACFRVCKNHAHRTDDDIVHTINRSACTRCFSCADACFSGALEVVGRKMTIDGVFAAVAEDTAFYEQTNGGVTLSGGEVMLQADFACELVMRCREARIHTAIETNLTASWKSYCKILPYTDLMMVDIKSMDDAAHMAATGISNKRILENIRFLASSGVPFIVRTPVIPGFSDRVENIGPIAAFVSSLKTARYYELLSYNPLGVSKAEMIGRSQKNLGSVTRETMKKLADCANQWNIRVYMDGQHIKQ